MFASALAKRGGGRQLHPSQPPPKKEMKTKTQTHLSAIAPLPIPLTHHNPERPLPRRSRVPPPREVDLRLPRQDLLPLQRRVPRVRLRLVPPLPLPRRQRVREPELVLERPHIVMRSQRDPCDLARVRSLSRPPQKDQLFTLSRFGGRRRRGGDGPQRHQAPWPQH